MSDTGFLHRYFLNNGENRLHKWVHYFDIYERHFAQYRDRPIKMLEIGVFGGGSLRMWRDYFAEGSTIVGIDINPECKQYEAENIDIHIGSQDDPEFLMKVAKQYGGFDIILDDGSHINKHVITSFETLYDQVAQDGVYFIEDMHTSYWSKWGGKLRGKDTFIEFAKAKIDELNATHVRGDFPVTEFTQSTDSIAFYDSIVVFEKRPQGKRQHVVTIAMPETK